MSAPTRRCRIDGPGLAITQVGWARHGQENYYAPTAGDSKPAAGDLPRRTRARGAPWPTKQHAWFGALV